MGTDFSWLKLEAFSIDELITLERLIMLEHCRRNAETLAQQAALKPVNSPAKRPTYPPFAGKPLQEIRPAIHPHKKTDHIADTNPSGNVTLRYQHPTVRGLRWSGRGIKPAWVREWLAGGGTLAQIRL